jgi:NAD(P)-dependent dehydrogenase (short-subunit alcohol dehydrogenase family)
MNFHEQFTSIPQRYPELSGKVALVTGSTRGIGKGIAARLAREGMRVVLTGRQQSDLDPLLADFEAEGAIVIGVAADLGQSGEASRLIDTVLQSYGQIDLLVNNAADLRRSLFYDVDEATFDYQFDVNVKSPFLLSQRAARVMRENKGGNIIFVSSVGGLRAHWRGMPYDATKGAVNSMVQAMALEAAAGNIRINAIAPGATWIERRGDTSDPRSQAVMQRIPLKRFGMPLEMGAAVAFLASPDAAYITGQVIYIDGGITAQLSPPGQDI